MGINKVYIFLLSFAFGFNFCIAQKSDSSLQISVMMPFCAKDIHANPNYTYADLGNASRQYYEGVLIAADSLKGMGFKINLNAYDTQKDSLLFLKQLKKKEIIESDFIIGPVIREAQLTILPFAQKNKKYHVSPLYTFTKTRISDPYLISPNPDLAFYADYLLEYLAKQQNAETVFIVQDLTSNDKVFSTRAKQLSSLYPKLKLIFADSKDPSIVKKDYIQGKLNPVIICSSDENNVNRLLNSVMDTTGVYQIQAIGFMQWLDFNTVNGKLWEQCQLHILSPVYIDYNRSLVKQFVKKYREKYEAEPRSFAFMGFDHMLYYGLNYLQSNKGFENISQSNAMDLLTNTFKTSFKNDIDGLQNSKINLLKWSNYQFERVKY